MDLTWSHLAASAKFLLNLPFYYSAVRNTVQPPEQLLAHGFEVMCFTLTVKIKEAEAEDGAEEVEEEEKKKPNSVVFGELFCGCEG